MNHLEQMDLLQMATFITNQPFQGSSDPVSTPSLPYFSNTHHQSVGTEPCVITWPTSCPFHADANESFTDGHIYCETTLPMDLGPIFDSEPTIFPNTHNQPVEMEHCVFTRLTSCPFIQMETLSQWQMWVLMIHALPVKPSDCNASTVKTNINVPG